MLDHVGDGSIDRVKSTEQTPPLSSEARRSATQPPTLPSIDGQYLPRKRSVALSARLRPERGAEACDPLSVVRCRLVCQVLKLE